MNYKWKSITAIFALSFQLLGAKEFVLCTAPKTGTHLLQPILEELTQKTFCPSRQFQQNMHGIDEFFENCKNNQQFMKMHALFSPELEAFFKKKDCLVVHVKRDPRDRIVSLLNHYKYIDFLDKTIEAIDGDDNRLLALIKNKLRPQALQFKGWLTSPVACVLSFEKLMGESGGAATDKEAIDELKKLTHALGLDTTEEELEILYNKHKGHSATFFKGKVGSWKDYFKEEHKVATKQAIGSLLIELGYENNLNW